MTDKTMTLDYYDAGLLGDGGGGDVSWWQDYIRSELARAHEFYQDQADAITRHLSQPAEKPCSLSEALNVIEHWGRRGNTLQGDDVSRLRALTDKIAPAERGEAVGRVEAHKSYDSIDRWMRNNMDDEEYAEYSAELDRVFSYTALTAVWHNRPAQEKEWKPYLKEGQTPFERFMQEVKDCAGAVELLRKERLKAEQAQEKAEPVAEVVDTESDDGYMIPKHARLLNEVARKLPVGTKLYTAPPPAAGVLDGRGHFHADALLLRAEVADPDMAVASRSISDYRSSLLAKLDAFIAEAAPSDGGEQGERA